MPNVEKTLSDLAALSGRRLFFVGGAPRSGTTWLQAILDAHPAVCCRGEGFFMQQLAAPIDAMMAKRAEVIADKNERIFSHTGGYLLPEADDTDLLVATGILLALQRQAAGVEVQAIGEKTPENAFFFPRLKHLFPRAKFIAIMRDPRDVLSSAWHFFPRPVPADEVVAKIDFINMALPSLVEGARAIVDFGKAHADALLVVTYEALKAKPAEVTKRLFGFLGVADDDSVVADCVARSSFEAMTQGRKPGIASKGSFFRKGVVGDWRQTLTAEMSALVENELGWTFAMFGWRR